MPGLSEVSPLSLALGVVHSPAHSNKERTAKIKRDLIEIESIETVFAGYPQERRVAFPELVPLTAATPTKPGQMEYKEKITQMDWTIPAANYDFRIGLASEKVVDANVMTPPPGWNLHRVKRRRSYKRRDTSMAWQIDVTEVTTTPKGGTPSVVHELELELRPDKLLQLINEESASQVQSLTKAYAQQLWWMLGQLNPLQDTVDVEEYLQPHPNDRAAQLALATCTALKKFMDQPLPVIGNHNNNPIPFHAPIAKPPHETISTTNNASFPGCMPVNFARHHIDEIQQSSGYYLSEKTDGVRHFMIFTGDTVVLVDRAKVCKQIKSKSGEEGQDPMAFVLPSILPGTVLDGEVVMHRGGSKHPARPIFIVFDVLTVGNETIAHLPFGQRLRHLQRATFGRVSQPPKDPFDETNVANPKIPLPLVRKNFVPRTQLSDLLRHVVEEKGARSFRKLPLHNHLTDGIIFQPDAPYVCGTDVHLLKWKYLDTVTIDVELLPPGYGRVGRHNDFQDEDTLTTGVMGTDQTIIDMSRYVLLPPSERYRLEADRFATNAKIAEVGFDPETGEWYYLTMRPDKVAPNHINTVLGTLLELSESLTAEELQYRMSVPPGQRDTYRKDLRGMLGQLLEHQQRKLGKK